MKKIVYFFLILFLASCGNDKTAGVSSNSPKEISYPRPTVQSGIANAEKGGYVEGELLVKFKSGVAASSSLGVHRAIGSKMLKRFSIVPNLEHVKLPEGLSVKDAITQYMNDPNVEYAEPNYIKRASFVFTNPDPLFDQQWALTKINAQGSPGAWDITTGSNSVVIAVLDTGIDFTHPDFVRPDGSSNISSHGSDFTHCLQSNDTCTKCLILKTPTSDPTDNNGHGTHVSGIIGAVGNNGIGVAGLNWNVQILPLKMLDSTGCGTTTDEIAAIEYAIQLKNNGTNIKVMNASFGSYIFTNAEFDEINQANSAGILLMAAAGNDGNNVTPNYPANYSLPNIISVAATTQFDKLASYSNFGNSVHVAAPGGGIFLDEGDDILSTAPLNLTTPFCDGGPSAGYEFCQGTSQAAPHVSGLAGLLYSVYPNFTYSQIRGMIIKYVDPLSFPIFSGGRINAYNAVSSLLTPTNLNASASSPTQISLSWSDNATGEDGYKVERKKSGGSFGQISTTSANASSFTDSGAADGTTYTYRIRAFNAHLPNPPSTTLIEADSSYSTEVTSTTPLNPPTNLKATNVTSTSLTLDWTDNSQSEDGYAIERKSPGGDFVQITAVGANVRTYSDSGLSPSTTYSYRVRAFSAAAGNSQYSNELPVTTASPNPAPAPSSGGGGGCSIGARQNAPTAIIDSVMLLIPFAVIAFLRRRKL